MKPFTLQAVFLLIISYKVGVIIQIGFSGTTILRALKIKNIQFFQVFYQIICHGP